ncbi:unnamed protein product, partial [Larinioides sclopetarius]
MFGARSGNIITNHTSFKNLPPEVKEKKTLIDIISAGTRQIWNKKVPGTQMEKIQNIIQDKYGVKFDEDGNELKVTFALMYEEVRLYLAAFKKNGLQKGDRVACYMSNRREAIYAMLAAASMGAMFGGPSPFYGTKGAVTILNIMKPKFLITVDRFQQNQNENNMLDRLPEIVNGVGCIEKVIIIPTNEKSKLKDISSLNN